MRAVCVRESWWCACVRLGGVGVHGIVCLCVCLYSCVDVFMYVHVNVCVYLLSLSLCICLNQCVCLKVRIDRMIALTSFFSVVLHGRSSFVE